MDTRQLIANRMRTPDGTLMHSVHRHDYQEYVDKNGDTYVLDGGNDYIRCSINLIPAVNESVYADDPHDMIREVFLWGTYGKDGKQPFKRIALEEMEDSHIQAILDTQSHIPYHVRKVFLDEQEYRIQHGITK